MATGSTARLIPYGNWLVDDVTKIKFCARPGKEAKISNSVGEDSDDVMQENRLLWMDVRRDPYNATLYFNFM